MVSAFGIVLNFIQWFKGCGAFVVSRDFTRSSAIAEGPRDASCQLNSCQLPRNSAETICTTSISCRLLTRTTKSCCRQRLTICAINYSGRASELGGIVDLVDRRRSSLSRSERPHFSTIDMPWRNFLSPEFTTKFQREVPLFLEITEFPFNTV